jgi:hypothetical protein
MLLIYPLASNPPIEFVMQKHLKAIFGDFTSKFQFSWHADLVVGSSIRGLSWLRSTTKWLI